MTLLRYVIEESESGGAFKPSTLGWGWEGKPAVMFFDNAGDEARESAYAQVRWLMWDHFPQSRITQDGHTIMSGDRWLVWRARAEEVKDIYYG